MRRPSKLVLLIALAVGLAVRLAFAPEVLAPGMDAGVPAAPVEVDR